MKLKGFIIVLTSNRQRHNLL